MNQLDVAKFMGAVVIETYPDHVLLDYVHKDKYPDNQRYHASSLLKYDSDWNWLMPVVVKIDKIASVVLGRDWVEVIAPRTGDMKYIKNHSGERIEATYRAVVEFIKWYNEKNSNI